MKRDPERLETVMRIVWGLVILFIAWATAPKLEPEKVNVKDLRGAAKHQALEQLARQ